MLNYLGKFRQKIPSHLNLKILIGFCVFSAAIVMYLIGIHGINHVSEIKTWEAISVSAGVISAFGIIVAMQTYINQAKNNKIQTTYQLFDRQLDHEVRSFENYLRYKFPDEKKNFDFSRGMFSSIGKKVEILSHIDGKVREYEINYIITKVAYIYNQFGYLAIHDAIDTDLIYISHGNDILMLWSSIGDVIEKHDEHKRCNYNTGINDFNVSNWYGISYLGGFKFLVDQFKDSRPSNKARMIFHMYKR